MLRHFSHDFSEGDLPAFVRIRNTAAALKGSRYGTFNHEDIVAPFDRMFEHCAAAFAGKGHEGLMMRKVDGIG